MWELSKTTPTGPNGTEESHNGMKSSTMPFGEAVTLKTPIRENVVHSPYTYCPIPNVSVYVGVKEALQTLEQHVVMVDATTSITATDLLAKLESYAAGFQLNGVKQGDRVCCHFANSIESFSALFGVIFAGGVAVLADDELTQREVVECAKSGCSEYIVTDWKNASKFVDYKFQVKKCFVVGGDVPGFVSTSEFGNLNRNAFVNLSTPDPKERMAAISFSSGSTGSPKAIVTTHYTLVSSIFVPRSSCILEPGDRCSILESMAHAFGLSFTTFAVCLGATVVITSTTPDFAELAEVVEKHKVEVICGFPTVLSNMSRGIDASGRELGTVRKIVSAGGPIHPALGDRILQQFHLTDFKNFLGCSEALTGFCMPPAGDKAYQSVGFPLSHVTMKVVSPQTGLCLGPGEKGELWVRTPTMSPGYLSEQGELFPVTDSQGWLHTGDIGYYNQDGRFFVVDRLKNIIKCCDYNVSPQELESILYTHPSVIECCVIGIPDERLLEAPTAFVVRRNSSGNDCSVTEEELVDLVASQTAYYKHLYGGVNFVDQIPKTVNGKQDRNRLKLLKVSGNVLQSGARVESKNE
ncbi:luciferin 4-monooxygenase-like isoform X1 [Haemaphysalis longicornis]